ncbi:22512_t:CDS:2, partial [Gigaspora margarita]
RQVLLLVDNTSSHTATETNNPTKVQDNTMKIDDSAKEIKEIQHKEEHEEGHEKGHEEGCKKEHEKLTIRKAIDYISNTWEEVREKATRIIPEMNEPEESELDDEPEDEIPEVNNAAILVSDFSPETNLVAQELESNINEYIYMTK